MKRHNKIAIPEHDPSKLFDPSTRTFLRDLNSNIGFSTMRLMGIVLVCLMVMSVLFSVSVVLRDPPSDTVSEPAEEKIEFQSRKVQSTYETSQLMEESKDVLLGGLLASGFNERSCLSRYQSALYRKEVPHKPSSYLISKLRSYEALHKKCGPHTESYKTSMEQLKSGHPNRSSDCNYVVWVSFSGLGNRMLSLVSTFLYALLTNRVLLVDPGVDMTDLFCEPFPEASWFLPSDFPLQDQFAVFDQKSPHCYGKILKDKALAESTKLKPPPFIYLHMSHDYDDEDKLFFCDEEQSFLKEVHWLIMKTNNYLVPSLFIMPSFNEELSNLFPQKDTVFHLLGRYLLHPTNPVWGLITRYYQAYLAKADERVGIQIRVFDTEVGPFQHVLDQILDCTVREKLLPETDTQEAMVSPLTSHKSSKAVLMTSLSSGYFEKVKNMYWEYPTVTGDVISIYQPSHEEYQKTEKHTHNRKAFAEMYLLSLTDVLVTSAWSTFGYVAQGLGGLKPWILYKPENRTAPDPPCQQAMSMEPCFHAPPFYDCKAKKGIDTGALFPHVKHCEDMSWGLKLVDAST